VSLYPLPDLILLSDYNDNWEDYIKDVYQIFLDTVVDKLTFLDLPIRCRYMQHINGMHGSFWHIVTSNPERSKNDEDRILDFERCERIKWIPHIINNYDNNKISCWENKRGNNNNIVLWLQEENYMIILSKRKDYYSLTTAYKHTNSKIKVNINERRKKGDPRKS
jgi:hypothetical protein